MSKSKWGPILNRAGECSTVVATPEGAKLAPEGGKTLELPPTGSRIREKSGVVESETPKGSARRTNQPNGGGFPKEASVP
ncbi:hypothetical protein GCM10027160_08480 [Streptomyces calidiresistens]